MRLLIFEYDWLQCLFCNKTQFQCNRNYFSFQPSQKQQVIKLDTWLFVLFRPIECQLRQFYFDIFLKIVSTYLSTLFVIVFSYTGKYALPESESKRNLRLIPKERIQIHLVHLHYTFMTIQIKLMIIAVSSLNLYNVQFLKSYLN